MQPVSSLKPMAVLVAGILLATPGVARPHGGDPQAEEALAAAAAGELLTVGSAAAVEVVAAVVARAAEVASEATACLLPPGTSVDGVAWDGAVLAIYLTVPAAPEREAAGLAGWYLTPTDAETLARGLARPFWGDSAFAGTRIRVRVGPDADYGTLEQFMPDGRPLPEPPAEPAERPLPLERSAPVPPPASRGPTINAARQPVGALTGVTVYASAGHGWTAGDTAWYTQRPVLLEMCEDYGNIDQLNYFVHYAFNAGATVVPFRPVGWQPLEIVLDNDDPGVTYSGTWSNGDSPKYYENGVTLSGVVYKWTSASTTETATASFTPVIPVTDFYPVYCFAIAGSNRTLQTYRVHHSGGVSEVTIDHREVGNGWVWLGNYYLEAGGDNTVQITNASPLAGAIIADAIRWGDGVGDIVRPGPGSVSGYPRDEEAQRYWAEKELGFNAVGFDSDIWDIPGYDDGSDNVRTAAKWAREMNQVPAGGVLVDRWKRVHLEFHTNASTGSARGQICLITDLGPTTYQTQYATILSDEVDADLLIMDDEFEHAWVDRSAPTYTSSYGAICTPANGDEFDATIVELAFHDNQQDAELLRDSRVRAAMARACVHGIIRFLNTLPGSQVPLAFAPDTPRTVRALLNPDGTVTLSWQAPLADGARGDPATGYVVYRSANGYGFGDPLILGNVLTTTLPAPPLGQTLYLRVAATNAGGESMPSEVLAVRRSAARPETVLIVNGFDRLRRQINPIQTFTQPPAYAGKSIERQIWERSNSFDYVVPHAEALAADDFGFASCANEAVIDGLVTLAGFDAVVWILGTESVQDVTFSTTEQSRLQTYLNEGGALFVSGADIAYDLINQAHGVSFAQDTLRIGYGGNSANTFVVTGAAGGCLAGIGPIDFDPANGASTEVRSPDVLVLRPDAVACLNYVGGTGGIAGVQYAAGLYNVVTLGFPFEALSDPADRAAVMAGVMAFLLTPHGPLPFDYDRDGDVDIADFGKYVFCCRGPGFLYSPGHNCLRMDGDADLDVDIEDFYLFQQLYTGALVP